MAAFEGSSTFVSRKTAFAQVFDKLRLTIGGASSGMKAPCGAGSRGLFSEYGSEAAIVRVLQNAGIPSGSGSAARYVILSPSKETYAAFAWVFISYLH